MTERCLRLDDMRRVAEPSSRRAIWPSRTGGWKPHPDGLRTALSARAAWSEAKQDLMEVILAIDEFVAFRYNEGTPPVVGLLYTVSFAPLYTTADGYFSTLQHTARPQILSMR